ncbi:MAG TPA: terminase TerL endonuclease subunit [Longimicrobiales bacterium]
MQGEFYFDEEEANRAVEFFRRFLRHSKGELAGQPFVLDKWQENEIIRPLFGWKRADGTRRYRTCYVEIPRKNGKTTLAAGVALYLLFADGEPGAEIYSAAGDRDQAAISFEIAKAMVEASPALRRRAKIFKRSIVVPSTGSSYKVISADAGTKHGFNSHGIIFDELHVQPNRDLYDTLHTSIGARSQPVEFLITTAGVYDPNSIAWELHRYAEQVRDGVILDDSFLPVIYSAGPDDDYRDPQTWKKANPGLGISVREEYLAAEAKRAEAEPSYENTFRRLHLNQWTQQVTRWIKIEDWAACEREFPDLSGRACYGGLDLSTTTDISALVLAFPPRFEDEPTYLLPFFWIPEAKLKDRRDRVPYELWARQGLVTVTDGDVVDYDRIRSDINALGRKYGIREIRFDPWNATQLATQLSEADGHRLTQMRQGFISMNEPSKEFERRIISGAIAHDGNPVLAWMIGSVAIKTDPAGNIKPDKSKSTERIDGVVASIMALSGVMADNGAKSVYTERGLIAL